MVFLARRADTTQDVADPEDLVDGHIGAHRVHRAHPDVLGDAVGEADACGVHQIIDEHGRHDFAAQLVAADLGAEPLAQLPREVGGQPGGERFLVRQVAGQHLVLEGELHMCHQGGQFRRGQPETQLETSADLLLAGQCLQLAVESAGGFEFLDLAGMHIEQRGARWPGRCPSGRSARRCRPTPARRPRRSSTPATACVRRR